MSWVYTMWEESIHNYKLFKNIVKLIAGWVNVLFVKANFSKHFSEKPFSHVLTIFECVLQSRKPQDT